jgi:hypothetical protein
MPDYFRVLEGAELEKASAVRENLVRKPWDDGIVPVDGEIRGRCVFEFGAIDELDLDHLLGLIAGADRIGESTVLICDDGVVEVELKRLKNFCETTDLSMGSGEDWHVPDALADWPEPAKQALTPIFVDGWALVSPAGKWSFASYGAGDDNFIIGTQAFLDAYAERRPEVAYDVLLWMHGDGSFIFSDRDYTKHAKGTLERFYRPDDAKWIWDTWVESRRALDLRPLSDWAGRATKLIEHFKSDQAIGARLSQIWRGT